MTLINQFFLNFWTLTNDLALYLIIGVMIAGVLKQIIPEGFIAKYLGENNLFSVIKASLFGMPLPLCSCSVIPFAQSLKKEGASSGSVLSFLISTPITGIDSLLATYGFFGWIFTLYRVVTSIIIATVAGVLQNIFGIDNNNTKFTQKSCCSSKRCETKKSRFSFKAAFDYALFDIFRDFAKPLFWGLVAGAVISTFLDNSYLSYMKENAFFGYFLILIISMPMYICATASLPIAAGLVDGGVSIGAAFVLLSAGPATNSVTMGVVLTTLGKRALFIYLLSISVLSILFGYVLDNYLGSFDLLKLAKTHEHLSIADNISAVILLILIFYFIQPLSKEKLF
jgi:uncharacterized membrane protein YraQ (UPF0718 family)